MNLQTNIEIYLVIQISTNEYPNIFLLGKWHEYKYKEYFMTILFEYYKFQIFVLITRHCTEKLGDSL